MISQKVVVISADTVVSRIVTFPDGHFPGKTFPGCFFPDETFPGKMIPGTSLSRKDGYRMIISLMTFDAKVDSCIFLI